MRIVAVSMLNGGQLARVITVGYPLSEAYVLEQTM